MKKSSIFFALSAAFIAAAFLTRWYGLLLAAALFTAAAAIGRKEV